MRLWSKARFTSSGSGPCARSRSYRATFFVSNATAAAQASFTLAYAGASPAGCAGTSRPRDRQQVLEQGRVPPLRDDHVREGAHVTVVLQDAGVHRLAPQLVPERLPRWPPSQRGRVGGLLGGRLGASPVRRGPGANASTERTVRSDAAGKIFVERGHGGPLPTTEGASRAPGRARDRPTPSRGRPAGSMGRSRRGRPGTAGSTTPSTTLDQLVEARRLRPERSTASHRLDRRAVGTERELEGGRRRGGVRAGVERPRDALDVPRGREAAREEPRRGLRRRERPQAGRPARASGRRARRAARSPARRSRRRRARASRARARRAPPGRSTIRSSERSRAPRAWRFHRRAVVDLPAPDWPQKSSVRPFHTTPQPCTSTAPSRARRCWKSSSSSG